MNWASTQVACQGFGRVALQFSGHMREVCLTSSNREKFTRQLEWCIHAFGPGCCDVFMTTWDRLTWPGDRHSHLNSTESTPSSPCLNELAMLSNSIGAVTRASEIKEQSYSQHDITMKVFKSAASRARHLPIDNKKHLLKGGTALYDYWYNAQGVYFASKLRRAYEERSNISYHVVVRIRYDQYLRPIHASSPRSLAFWECLRSPKAESTFKSIRPCVECRLPTVFQPVRHGDRTQWVSTEPNVGQNMGTDNCQVAAPAQLDRLVDSWFEAFGWNLASHYLQHGAKVWAVPVAILDQAISRAQLERATLATACARTRTECDTSDRSANSSKIAEQTRNVKK
eukprot:6185519-Pleurochrysis_carterae.AAC.7